MSGRAATPWTHVPVSGAISSCLARQLPMAPLTGTWAQRAGAQCGRRAGVVRGGGACAREGGEGEARARGGRRAARACGIGSICGWGRCARARAGAGRGRAPPSSISYSSPVEQRKVVVDHLGLRCGARATTPPPRQPVRSAARWACVDRCTVARSCERAQRPVAPAGGKPAAAHLTATLDGHGATKNATWERANVAERHPLHSPLDLNSRSLSFCACTAALHLSAGGEKGAQLPRARMTQDGTLCQSGRRGPART